MKNILLAGLIGIWATVALAHSPLESSSPADGATISKVPSEVLFHFKRDIRLTRVTMTYTGREGIDLDLNRHDGFISDHVVPTKSMGDGDYMIEWRGLGSDGHALKGASIFTVE